MAIIKKDDSVLLAIEKAQAEREKKLAYYKAKIDVAKATIRKSSEQMSTAITDDTEDLDTFSAARRNKLEAQDALELYQNKCDALDKAPLFGDDTQKMFRKLIEEQRNVEYKAIREIIPLLDKVWSLAADAREEYTVFTNCYDTILAHSGISSTSPAPQELLNVLRAMDRFMKPEFREKYK